MSFFAVMVVIRSNAEIDLANSAAAIAQAWGELYAATGRLPR